MGLCRLLCRTLRFNFGEKKLLCSLMVFVTLALSFYTLTANYSHRRTSQVFQRALPAANDAGSLFEPPYGLAMKNWHDLRLFQHNNANGDLRAVPEKKFRLQNLAKKHHNRAEDAEVVVGAIDGPQGFEREGVRNEFDDIDKPVFDLDESEDAVGKFDIMDDSNELEKEEIIREFDDVDNFFGHDSESIGGDENVGDNLGGQGDNKEFIRNLKAPENLGNDENMKNYKNLEKHKNLENDEIVKMDENLENDQNLGNNEDVINNEYQESEEKVKNNGHLENNQNVGNNGLLKKNADFVLKQKDNENHQKETQGDQKEKDSKLFSGNLDRMEESKALFQRMKELKLLHYKRYKGNITGALFYNISRVYRSRYPSGYIKHDLVSKNQIKLFTDNVDIEKFQNMHKGRREKNLVPSRLLLPAPEICRNRKSTSLYLLILVPSVWSHEKTRQTIRDTWAAPLYAENGSWFGMPLKKPVRLVFLIGSPGSSRRNIVRLTGLEKEVNQYKDIVMMDFMDSYRNLTMKIAAGLQWAQGACPSVNHVMKVDEDTFVHLPQLLNVLQAADMKEKRFVLGHRHSFPEPKVARGGRWRVGEEYPFEIFPAYLYGHSYVISGPSIPSILDMYRKLPPIFVEDVFFTGISAKLSNISRFHHKAFAVMGRPESVCAITHGMFISVTPCCDQHHLKIDRDMKSSLCDQNTLRLYPVPGCRHMRDYNANMSLLDRDPIGHRLLSHIMQAH